MDSFHEIASCDRKGRLAASEPALLERDKRKSIFVRLAGEGNDDVVTAFFLLVAHYTREPPDRRMVKKKSLGKTLEQIHQIVVTANMRRGGPLPTIEGIKI